MGTTIRSEIIYLNEQSCNCKMTIIITPTIGATAFEGLHSSLRVERKPAEG